MTDTPETIPAIKALLDYGQADMDGIVVTTSRQAIHEVVDVLAERDACIAELEAENAHLRNEVVNIEAEASEGLMFAKARIQTIEARVAELEAGSLVWKNNGEAHSSFGVYAVRDACWYLEGEYMGRASGGRKDARSLAQHHFELSSNPLQLDQLATARDDALEEAADEDLIEQAINDTFGEGGTIRGAAEYVAECIRALKSKEKYDGKD